MAASEHQCINHDKEGVEHDGPLREVVSNDLGARIHVCESCTKTETPCEKCGLCDGWHTGKTLKVKNTFVFAKDDDDDSFCYECVGEELPKFMHKFFTQRNSSEKHAIHLVPYYKEFGPNTGIDFSSPDTIRLTDRQGVAHAPKTPGAMGSFGHVLYQISLEVPGIDHFLRYQFIDEMRRQHSAAQHATQIMRDLCVDEAESMMRRVAPTSDGCSCALDLLPPNVFKKSNAVVLRDMRRVTNFNQLLGFVRKYK